MIDTSGEYGQGSDRSAHAGLDLDLDDPRHNVVDSLEIKKPELWLPVISYHGRIEFGTGTIDASEVSEEEFKSLAETAASKHTLYVPNPSAKYGSCMDGRDMIASDDGRQREDLQPRPKVIGGPSWFGWAVAAAAGLSTLDSDEGLLEQFRFMNELMNTRGIGLGMHHRCGAAMGSAAVTQKLHDNFDEIVEMLHPDMKDLSKILGKADMGRIRDNAGRTADKIGNQKDFTDENMIYVVKRIAGEKAIVTLEEDHDHDTHGHVEEGLIFVRRPNAVIAKNNFNKATNAQMFWQNNAYARTIAGAVSSSFTERATAELVGDMLAIAGVATLGRGHQVASIEDPYRLQLAA